MQIKAGMGNVEEDIAQEGNANKGKALRWCLRNREEDGGREKGRYTGRTNEGTRREEVENEDRERLRRQGGKVRRRTGRGKKGTVEGRAVYENGFEAKFGGLVSLQRANYY